MTIKEFVNRLWNLEFMTFLLLLVTIFGVIESLNNTNGKNNSGNIVITSFLDTSFVPSAQLEPGLSKYLNIKYKGTKIDPKNIEVMNFNIQNASNKIITPKDFYKPITMSINNGIFLSVNITQPPNTPNLNMSDSEKTVIIKPTLLNPGDSFGITVLVLRKNIAPLFGFPKGNTIKWTALIKGINLVFSNQYQQENNGFLSKIGLNVYIFHTGYYALALFFLGAAMSMLQILRFFISKESYKSHVYKSLAISARVAISWAAAESIVSIFDMPNLAPIGYISILIYIIVILLPSGPRLISMIRKVDI
ncbi:MAG: hypothetical protein M0003_09395 [Acidithiobacillus sp.]|nr:hypothetical protein [Acidithiobacillus sp.]